MILKMAYLTTRFSKHRQWNQRFDCTSLADGDCAAKMARQACHYRDDDEHCRILAVQLDQLRPVFPWGISGELDLITPIYLSNIRCRPGASHSPSN
jgi:hypothetical protein